MKNLMSLALLAFAPFSAFSDTYPAYDLTILEHPGSQYVDIEIVDVNNAGEAVGYGIELGSGAPRPIYWSVEGVPYNIPFSEQWQPSGGRFDLSDANQYGIAISDTLTDLGQCVVFGITHSPQAGHAHPFYWLPSERQAHRIGNETFNEPWPEKPLISSNEKGEFVLTFSPESNVSYYWSVSSPSELQLLNQPGALSSVMLDESGLTVSPQMSSLLPEWVSEMLDLNDYGEFVGRSHQEGHGFPGYFKFSEGNWTCIQIEPEGYAGGYASSINNSVDGDVMRRGVVGVLMSGESIEESEQLTAFYWNPEFPDVWTELPPLSVSSDTNAYQINDQGSIIGISGEVPVCWFYGSQRKAYSKGVDLNDLSGEIPNGHLSEPIELTSNGTVLVRGIVGESDQFYLLKPKEGGHVGDSGNSALNSHVMIAGGQSSRTNVHGRHADQYGGASPLGQSVESQNDNRSSASLTVLNLK